MIERRILRTSASAKSSLLGGKITLKWLSSFRKIAPQVIYLLKVRKHVIYYTLHVRCCNDLVEQQDRHLSSIENPSVGIRCGPKLLRIKPSNVIGRAGKRSYRSAPAPLRRYYEAARQVPRIVRWNNPATPLARLPSIPDTEHSCISDIAFLGDRSIGLLPELKEDLHMSTVLITSRVVGTTVLKPVEMLKAAGVTIAENPHLKAGKNLREDQLVDLIKGIDAIIVGEDDVTRKVIEHADRLKIISKNGVGVNQIDVAAATEKGIFVTNTPGANSNAVADLTFGLMFSTARRIPFAHNAAREGKWDKFIGAEIWKKTIGIVGIGHIGKGVAKRARGFEMRILGYDVVQDQEFAKGVGLTYVPLEAIFREADFITLHVPLTKDTEGLVTRDHLRLMKKTAYLVNIARGGVVRSVDLYDALISKELAGAALDVFEDEPPVGNPLLTLDNVVTTPHIGAFTWESMENMGSIAAQNVIDVLQGRRPAFAVNLEVFER